MGLTDKQLAAAAFLVALEKLCKEHNISIAHEDCHGGFILVNYSEDHMSRMKSASAEFETIRTRTVYDYLTDVIQGKVKPVC